MKNKNTERKININIDVPVFHRNNNGVDMTITFSENGEQSVSKESLLEILFHSYETRVESAVY